MALQPCTSHRRPGVSAVLVQPCTCEGLGSQRHAVSVFAMGQVIPGVVQTAAGCGGPGHEIRPGRSIPESNATCQPCSTRLLQIPYMLAAAALAAPAVLVWP